MDRRLRALELRLRTEPSPAEAPRRASVPIAAPDVGAVDAGRSDVSASEAAPIPPAAAPPPADAAPSAAATGIPRSQAESGPGSMALVGRTLLAMGGAFLLRAATDAGALPATAGVALGILYGMFWLDRSGREAQRQRMASATFHGLVAALVVFPALVESTLKFDILPRQVTAILLPSVWIAGVAVAALRHVRSVAWIFCVGGGVGGVVLAAGSGFYPPFVIALMGMALGGLWLGYLRGWGGLAVVGSGVADFVVLAMTVLSILRPEAIQLDHLTPTFLFSMQLSLVVLYLASYVVRALVQGRHISVLEILQAVTAFAIGMAGALYTTRVDPALGGYLGVFSALVGVLCYAVAFLYVDQKAGRRRNFAFFTSSALVASIAGAVLLLDGMTLTAVLLTASACFAALGARFDRATLSLHGAIYVFGAGASSGLLGFSLDAFIGEPAPVPAAGQLTMMLVVIAVALACSWTRVVYVGRTWGRWSRLPKAIDLLVLAVGVDGLLVLGLSRFFLGAEGAFDAGAIAAVRTGVLAIAATSLGALSGRPNFREAARLVPLFLAFGALTLALGDLRQGRPVTLVFSMVLYGGALILAPRLARSGQTRTPGA